MSEQIESIFHQKIQNVTIFFILWILYLNVFSIYLFINVFIICFTRVVFETLYNLSLVLTNVSEMLFCRFVSFFSRKDLTEKKN